MITWKEVGQIVRKVLRWWWIVVVAIAVTTSTAFYLSKNETRFYVAHASLMVSDTIRSTTPDQNQILLGSVLARFYSELAHREPILKPVQETLNLPFPWQVINNTMLVINVVPSANLLEIYITDSDPTRAAAIANALGEHLMAYSPTSPDKIQAERAAIEQQLQETDARIKQIKVKISEAIDRQKQLSSASDLAEANNTLAELNQSLSNEESSYNALLSFKNNSVINSLSFFERAAPPLQPLPTLRRVTLAMAALGGLLIALLAIFLLEHLDPRWSGTREVKERFNLDYLGYVPNGPPMLIAAPSFFEERFRAARDTQTNILLAAPERGVRTLMLTSPQPSESRTALSIDLADLFARSGNKVLLVDAEFTNSFLTRMLASPGTAHTWTVTRSDEPIDIWTHLRPTPLPNVALLAGRSETDGAPALLPSLRWREIVRLLSGVADVIIIDGPATLNGPDAALLAPHVEGVVLALDPIADSREDVNKSKARLSRQEGSNLLGAVVFMPSQHQFDTRRMLTGPIAADQATIPASAPTPQPVASVNLFGRKIQFVWGGTARKRKQAAPPEAPQPAMNGAHPAAVYAPESSQYHPIITPAPPVEVSTTETESEQQSALEPAIPPANQRRARKGTRQRAAGSPAKTPHES